LALSGQDEHDLQPLRRKFSVLRRSGWHFGLPLVDLGATDAGQVSGLATNPSTNRTGVEQLSLDPAPARSTVSAAIVLMDVLRKLANGWRESRLEELLPDRWHIRPQGRRTLHDSTTVNSGGRQLRRRSGFEPGLASDSCALPAQPDHMSSPPWVSGAVHIGRRSLVSTVVVTSLRRPRRATYVVMLQSQLLVTRRPNVERRAVTRILATGR
jgi:hypothetical protein